MPNIESSVIIDSNLDTVWRLISKPGHLEQVHPFCQENILLESQDGKILRDKLIYLNGLEYIREFKSWNINKGYDLLIGKKNGQQSRVKWRLSKKKNGIKLSINIYPYTSKKINSFIYPVIMVFIIRPKLKKYLFSVLNGIKWNVEQKRPVAHNQFGMHSWFS